MAEDDFVRINTQFVGTLNLRLSKVGMEWPPPERIVMDRNQLSFRKATADDDPAVVLRRIRMSRITDEQIEGMNCVARGAEYKYETDVNVGAKR